MKRYDSILELVGATPMVKIHRVAGHSGAEVWAKLESFNPGGSVKDRIAWNMVREAEVEGRLLSGGMIVEPTSGNTGIGLAVTAACRGYRLVLCMPDSMSVERRNLLKAYGAELILTPGHLGMKGAMAEAQRIVDENEGAFMPQQFRNDANPEVHRKTTALEIWEQMDGRIDAFVAGVGTGGTITGVGEVLKQKCPSIEVIAVEPASSPVLSGGNPGPHGIQGIGAGFVPQVLNTDIFDEVVTVKESAAANTALEVARREGILVGPSSGAAMYAAVQTAKRLGKGKHIVVLFPDSGERYLSLRK